MAACRTTGREGDRHQGGIRIVPGPGETGGAAEPGKSPRHNQPVSNAAHRRSGKPLIVSADVGEREA